MTDDSISRQAAIDLFNKLADDPWNANAYTTWSKAYSYATEYIEELPSEQPEIIRCKDCKHWGIHKWLNIPWCREMHIDRGAEDFCSNAERKEDE